MKKVVLIALFIIFATVSCFGQATIGTEIGDIAPEIKLPDIDGNQIPLSSLRGKVVLINFWAAWCRPCQTEIPNLVKIYSEYNDEKFSIGNGFTIYGVSLDKDKKQWISTIEKNNLSWTNVSDLQYWKSEGVKIFNVAAVPSYFLIDGNGIIIAKTRELRGKGLLITLESLK
jgi:peroxiredoxin